MIAGGVQGCARDHLQKCITATYSNTSQHTTYCTTLQHTAAHCSTTHVVIWLPGGVQHAATQDTLHYTATRYSALQHDRLCLMVAGGVQHIATHDILHYTATRCSAPQHD